MILAWGMGINEHIWVMALVYKLSAYHKALPGELLSFWVYWYKTWGHLERWRYKWVFCFFFFCFLFFFLFFLKILWSFLVCIPIFVLVLWYLSLISLLVSSFFIFLFYFGVGLVLLFFLSSVDLLTCLIFLVFVVNMDFLQLGCLELLINEIWVDTSKFYSLNNMQPVLP